MENLANRAESSCAQRGRCVVQAGVQMKRVAILQSNYIPWKGYFDIIRAVDEFIIYDDVQYTRQNWRNRNRIKTPQGLLWLTVPVLVRGLYKQTIRETQIDGQAWAESHWRTLAQNYSRASCFKEVAEVVEPVYRKHGFTHLSVLNRELIEAICGYLGIRTRISNSWDYTLLDGKSERLADLCRQAGAEVYVSGPSARGYLDERVFAEQGIHVEWVDYCGYPEYPQLWGPFVHEVSILDLLFNVGRDAPRYMKHADRAPG